MKGTDLAIIADQLSDKGKLRKGLFVIAGIGALSAAAASAYTTIYPKPPDGFAGWILIILFLGLILAGAIPALLGYFEKTPEALVLEIKRISEQRDRLSDKVSYIAEERDAVDDAYRHSVTVGVVAQAISEATDAVVLAQRFDRREVAKSQLLAVLDRLIERKSELFGIKDDRWTFGVYVKVDKKLFLAVTRRWSRQSEDELHRAWDIGMGHVGQAFKARRELICADSRRPEVAGFVAASGVSYRDYDTERYVSFASIPIMIGDREEPLGVLVATSDHVARFTPDENLQDGDIAVDSVEPLRLAASVMATILCLTEGDGQWASMSEEPTHATC